MRAAPGGIAASRWTRNRSRTAACGPTDTTPELLRRRLVNPGQKAVSYAASRGLGRATAEGLSEHELDGHADRAREKVVAMDEAADQELH